MKSIRVDGIYNIETYKKLREIGVNAYSFDFRPRSLNFLQQYRFMELLETSDGLGSFYLHYAYEPDFVIQKMVVDLKTNHSEIFEQILLTFSDTQALDFYEKFKMNFAVEFQSDEQINRLIESPLLKEVIINYSDLEMHHGQGNVIQFLQKIFQLKSNRTDLQLSLRLNWDFDRIDSIFDFFQFDQYIVSINQQIESQYRQVDLQKLHQSIDIIAQQLTFSS